jgi:hypothetical protein
MATMSNVLVSDKVDASAAAVVVAARMVVEAGGGAAGCVVGAGAGAGAGVVTVCTWILLAATVVGIIVEVWSAEENALDWTFDKMFAAVTMPLVGARMDVLSITVLASSLLLRVVVTILAVIEILDSGTESKVLSDVLYV